MPKHCLKNKVSLAKWCIYVWFCLVSQEEIKLEKGSDGHQMASDWTEMHQGSHFLDILIFDRFRRWLLLEWFRLCLASLKTRKMNFRLTIFIPRWNPSCDNEEKKMLFHVRLYVLHHLFSFLMKKSFLTLDLRWNPLSSMKIVKCAHNMSNVPIICMLCRR